MICCSNASSILAAPDLEAAIPQGDLVPFSGKCRDWSLHTWQSFNKRVEVACWDQAWVARKPPPPAPPPRGRPAALCPGLQRRSHRVALFPFGWATRVSPTRASFYIHFLAQEALSHTHSASLEPYVHMVTCEVLISHGNIFLPFRAPGRWQSWHIPRLAAEIAASFQAQVGCIPRRALCPPS